MRRDTNLNVSNVEFSTKLHLEENYFAPLSKLYSHKQACNMNTGSTDFKKGCGYGVACLTLLESFLMLVFSICWVFKQSKE